MGWKTDKKKRWLSGVPSQRNGLDERRGGREGEEEEWKERQEGEREDGAGIGSWGIRLGGGGEGREGRQGRSG